VVTCKIKHFQKCFRAVDFLRRCRGRKNVLLYLYPPSKTFLQMFCKCFIVHVTTSYLQHVFSLVPPVDRTMHDQSWAGHREPLMASPGGHQCSAGQRSYQQQPLHLPPNNSPPDNSPRFSIGHFPLPDISPLYRYEKIFFI